MSGLSDWASHLDCSFSMDNVALVDALGDKLLTLLTLDGLPRSPKTAVPASNFEGLRPASRSQESRQCLATFYGKCLLDCCESMRPE